MGKFYDWLWKFLDELAVSECTGCGERKMLIDLKYQLCEDCCTRKSNAELGACIEREKK